MAGGLTFFTVIPTTMMGIIAIYLFAAAPPDDPFTIYPDLAINHVPFAIGIALLMGVLGASMSTANGGLLAISSVISRNIIQRDILRRMLKRPGMEDRKLLRTTRIFTIPMMALAFILGYFLPQPGIYLILAFDIVFAGAVAPLTLGLFWRKSNMPAAIASLVIGSILRLIFFIAPIIPTDLIGIETLICPPISFVAFVVVALATQKKYPGEQRHGVVDYIPPEEDIIRGEDLKGYVPPTGGKLA
jgi:Na+/proline symporter